MLSHSQHFLGQLLLGLLCFCTSPAQGDYFTNPASFELDQAGAQITTQNLNTTYTLGEKVQLTWVVPNVPYISLVLVHWGKDEGVPVASFITNDRNKGYYTWFVGESDGLTEVSIKNNPNFALRIVDPTGNYTKTGDPPGFIDNELQSRGFVIKSKAETGPKASSANLSIGAVAGIAIGSFAVGALVPEMKIDPARAKALVSQLQAVQERVTAVAAGRNVRLVAVSKLKPANDVLALHQATPPQLHFGENYAQELGQKAELLPRSIQWHFIGGLQSTHAKKLAKIPNLFCVSSVDTLKKAQLLNTSRAELIASSPDAEPLGIHVQVNTSGEESKSGASPGEETVALCRAVKNDCPSLRLLGLMTIGAIARSKATTPENENEDFLCLREQRDLVTKELGLDRELELSMGMSEDFEGAVRLGSGEVRVGSTIFGERGPKNEAKVVV
ncbi:Pyridoxal phosphate homeostasis protein [Colletotrichum sp. SAR11_240]|nr:Pyridoxal phosphate homeostasis protein [Colletotrichum sp. SAR11_240]